MSRIFICKISDQYSQQFNENFYAGGEKDSSWYGGLEIGDYVFPVFRSKIEKLWKVIEFSSTPNPINEEGSVKFELIKEYVNPISIASTFVRYKHFIININLLNKIAKSTASEKMGFHKIDNDSSCPPPDQIDFSQSRNIYVSIEYPIKSSNYNEKDLRVLIDNKDSLNIKDIQIFNNGIWSRYEILYNLYKKRNEDDKLYSLKELLDYSVEDKAKNKNRFLLKTIENIKTNGIIEVTNPIALYDNILVGRKRTANLKIEDNDNKNNKKFWLYAPGENASLWDEFYNDQIMGLGWDRIGDLNDLKSKEDIRKKLQVTGETESNKKNDTKTLFQFKNIMSPGDIVISKRGRKEYLGYGIVTSDYYYDKKRNSYQKCREVNWKKKGLWDDDDKSIPIKTLTDITDNKDLLTKLIKLIGIEDNSEINQRNNKMSNPLNQILYGPPGTGKTYQTILRAAEIIENRKIDDYQEALKIFKANLHDRIEFITFHQNYSYEDFIQGLRPDTENESELTFEKKDGVFKILADKALRNFKDSENPITPKKTFDDTFEIFVRPLVEDVDEIEVKMKKVSYYITSVSNKSISFRKASGGTAHTLNIATLKKMYEDETLPEMHGLGVYYLPLVNELLSIGKDTTGKKIKVEKKNYVIVIDEINRANISRVFGELITLIEPDKRSHGDIPMEAKLPSGDKFVVPSNLFIIGTMNTADKSIALLDIALRRRFEFEAMYPDYEIDGINDIEILQGLNKLIIEKKGHDFQIGHSYFMNDSKDLVKRMNKKVIPLLLEYFMNDKKEVEEILEKAGLNVDKSKWPLEITGKKNDQLI
ncbi:MAG TPA: AAA family ATPase [Ignavibacteria bacterium]|nr:AAA family ATPase [Ignavibacteria bacterium]HMR41476.1 AAA family ATPase [Ignavibacteria bacterium]